MQSIEGICCLSSSCFPSICTIANVEVALFIYFGKCSGHSSVCRVVKRSNQTRLIWMLGYLGSRWKHSGLFQT
uniref:Uncharacterized protein n=1 Tax=Physcomitrium patens TaxID=3218 RepID=A0A2K1KC20_PHYPA|nr:hypothetical protein PHYPA_010520 [Physcomitrium patens]